MAIMRRIPVFALAASLAVAGCHCGKKSDEEILKERIDTTSVHLYLATKVAITKSDSSPEVKQARKDLLAALEVLSRVPAHLRGSAAPPPAASATGPAPAASATDVAPAASASPGSELTAADMAKLVKALWGLRSEGKEILESGREDTLPPVLPILLGRESLDPEIQAIFDTNTEHALFFLVLFGLKFHPRSPVPVPPEILLYEAWMTKTDKLKLAGMVPPVHSLKAVIYGQNELCDLSAAEGEGLEKYDRSKSGADLAATFKVLGANPSALDAKEQAELDAAWRALAHGAAAGCFLQRDEKEKALDSLGKFITAAHDAGVPPAETAIVRAYLAYEKEDYETAKKCLQEAKESPSVDEETKKQIDALTKSFAEKDDAAISKFFDKTYFRVLCAKLILLRLERSGALDEIGKTEVVKKARDYLFGAARILGSAKESIPSFDAAKKLGGSLFD
jgi:hypothetical protein